MKPGASAHASCASAASPAVRRCRSMLGRGRHDARRSAERRATLLGAGTPTRASVPSGASMLPRSWIASIGAIGSCSWLWSTLGRRTRHSGRRFACGNLPATARTAPPVDCIRARCLTCDDRESRNGRSGISGCQGVVAAHRDGLLRLGRPGDARRHPRVSPRLSRRRHRARASPAVGAKALRQLARRAAWAFDEGLVHLVQRRNGPDDFSYFAIKRPRPRGPCGQSRRWIGRCRR